MARRAWGVGTAAAASQRRAPRTRCCACALRTIQRYSDRTERCEKKKQTAVTDRPHARASRERRTAMTGSCGVRRRAKWVSFIILGCGLECKPVTVGCCVSVGDRSCAESGGGLHVVQECREPGERQAGGKADVRGGLAWVGRETSSPAAGSCGAPTSGAPLARSRAWRAACAVHLAEGGCRHWRCRDGVATRQLRRAHGASARSRQLGLRRRDTPGRSGCEHAA
jgi:hypothetical protein